MVKVVRMVGFFLFLLSISIVGVKFKSVSAQSSTSEIVLYAAEATVRTGNYQVVSDSSAAGGSRLWNQDAGAAKLSDALANPGSYFELTFSAQAGTAYRLWLRGKAEQDSPYNDSVFVQFSDAVDGGGTAQYRIGTATATVVNLEDCSGCGLSGWGWQDNGWGVGVMGPLIYFQTSGTHTLRVQPREDGLSIDQVVLSAQAYLNSAPGALRNDTTILPPTGGGSPPPPPGNLPPVVTVTASVTSGTAPLYVFFNSSASDPDGYIASYSWTFGDGGTANQASSPYTYNSAGTYTARLTVTDNLGASASASIIITASGAPQNQPPIVSISASPTSGTAPLNVNFTSNASDPDGYIAAYNWTFGDGGTSVQASPSHTYTSSGTYTARLTVTDNLGATASATVTITVSNAGSTNLRIISWNSQGGDGTDYVHDLDRQAAYLAARNPDVVAMCESYQFSGGENQGQILASRLTQRTGATWNYYWAPKFPGCEEGNLILTKWQVVSTSYRYLSYNRSVAQMTINVNGKIINFFATHLDDAASVNRTQEAVELKNYMSGFAEPRFVAGDFNGGPDTSEIAQMVSSYFDSWNEAMNAGTASAYADNPVQWMTRTRRGRIDYIFYSRNAASVSVSNANIPDVRDLSRAASELLGTPDDLGVRPSDHNMMVATFQVR